MKRLVLPLLLIVACVAAPAADAKRSATVKETRSIARAARATSSCIKAIVSTDAAGWAAYYYRSSSARCRRESLRVGDGPITVYVRRSSGTWKRRGSASDCGKPRQVPVSAWYDLTPACADFDVDGTPLADR